MRILFYLIFILSFCLNFSFKSYSQVLPQNRTVDWSLAGYKGSIPNYATVVNIEDYGGVGDGVVSNDSAFSNALNALAGSEGVILFPAGEFLFKTRFVLRSGLILRGASSDSTTLKFDLEQGNSFDAITISGSPTNTSAILINDAIRDSSFVYVDDATGFLPGDYIKISFNDSSLLFSAWAYGLVGQIIKIKDVISNKIILESPLRLNYQLYSNPKITKLEMITGVGIECLKIHRNDETISQTSNIVFSYAAQCWISGIESYFCNFAHVAINSSTNISIQGSYFHNAHAFGGGGQGYGVLCQATSGECLIENNIFKLLRHSMLLQSGANGNVFGYNYSIEPFWDEAVLPSNSAGDMVLHGNWPYANLFEGNIGQNVVIDDSHGKNGAFNTFFRNRAELFGIFMNFNPASDSQNFIGNEVTNSDSGLYFLNGTNHFEYGNNIKGVIHATGTTNLSDTSYYLTVLPNSLNTLENWPNIGIPNVIKSGSIPAKERYLNTDFTTCSSTLPARISIDNSSSSKFNIYPNPTFGLVYLSANNLSFPIQVEIYNYLGQLVGSYKLFHRNQAIDVSRICKGIYLVKAKNKQFIYEPSKLVIE